MSILKPFFRRLTPSDWGVCLSFILFCGLSFALPIIVLSQKSLPFDWIYFNSLSLVVKSEILAYHVFPLHDPWVCGGVDILANPQNRIFSPFIFLDLIFSPQTANLASFIILGLCGMMGMFKLLRHVGVSKEISIVGSLLFINSSFFGLHFAVGHIAYGTFQLIPWFFYAILQMEQERYQFLALSLLALFILDGGINTFVYALFLTPCAFLIKPGLMKKSVDPKTSLSLFAMFIALTAAKTIPATFLISNRIPRLLRSNMPLDLTFQALFNPFQHPFTRVPSDQPFGFWEYGWYLGIVSFILLLVHLFIRKKIKEDYKWFVLLVIWFWVGSGWGGIFNPWTLFEKLPLFQNIRVQSRVFLLCLLFASILISKALDKGTPGILRGILICFLVGESFFVKNYAFFHFATSAGIPNKFSRLISSRNLEETLPFGKKPDHYFNLNKGAVVSYEPAAPRTEVTSRISRKYRGEAFIEGGKGEAKIVEYIPGKITVDINLQSVPSIVAINTNSLLGWKLVEGKAQMIPHESNLVAFKASIPKGRVVLAYQPFYFFPILALFGLGFALFLIHLKRLYFAK